MKLIISFITYNQNSAKYLEALLASLKQSIAVAKNYFSDLEISFFVFDNSDKDGEINKNILLPFFLNNNFVHKIWDENENLGFAKSYNIMINEALKEGTDLFLLINPDVLVDDNFILELIKKAQTSPEISVFCPKILYWDFANNVLSDIIDSYGVSLDSYHRFFDRGQGLLSSEYSDREQEIFGFSGAGALFRLSKMLDVANFNGIQREFFDEMMFMYKEDVDLSYRLQLAAKRILFVPQAIMYHDRSLSSLNNSLWHRIFTSKKSSSAEHSLVNQLIVLEKIKRLPFSLKVKYLTKVRKILLMIFSLLFAKKSLKKFLLLRVQIEQKGLKISPKMEEVKKIELFMKNS